MEEICNRMEDLGYSAAQTEEMELAIANSEKMMQDIVASAVVELSAMEGRVSPAITTDPSQLSRFWKEVFSFAQSNGLPFKYKKGAAEFADLTARVEVIS